MIHGLGLLATMAPDIAEAALEGLTRKVVSIAIDEAGTKIAREAEVFLDAAGHSLSAALSEASKEAASIAASALNRAPNSGC